MAIKPAQSAYSRLFVIDGGARFDRRPIYLSVARLTGVSRGYGDVTPIEVPHPNQAGKFIIIGNTRGAVERPTASIEGRFPMASLSTLMKIASGGCTFDVHLHFGSCTDMSDFTTFEKAIILEGAIASTYSTDDLGALASGDNALVNETVEFSAEHLYEMVPMSLTEKASNIVTNEVVDVALCDSASCGDCGDASDGCQKIFAVTLGGGGSPSTPPDVLYSRDGGISWVAYDVNSATVATNPTAIGCVDKYVVVVADNGSVGLHYALKSDFESGAAPAFSNVTAGFTAGRYGNAVSAYGSSMFIAADGGYVYKTQDPTAGVSAMTAGEVVADDLEAIHAYSDDMVVAVGRNGAVVYTLNGNTFSAATRPVGVGVNLNAVLALNESNWIVGASNGNLYYTTNGGKSWTAKSFPGSGSGSVTALAYATKSVLYMAHTSAAGAGRILRSLDGGNSWKLLPDTTTGTMPPNDRINALVSCYYNPNMLVAVGLGDNGTDGIVVVGG